MLFHTGWTNIQSINDLIASTHPQTLFRADKQQWGKVGNFLAKLERLPLQPFAFDS